jgi:hypothetical protein
METLQEDSILSDVQKILDRKEAKYKTIKEFGPVQSVQASDADSQIEEDFILL